MQKLRISMILSTLLLASTNLAMANEAVKDNSFLIEEAYNQEPGVVQFINGYQYSELTKDSTYTFTNEIPIHDETHQFSFAIPIIKKNGPPSESGIGDVLINYRYQLVNNEHIAIAPRLSIIIPSGDYKKGLGNGVAGLQFNQAVSISINDKWTNHWNAGFTYTPDAENAVGETASLTGYNFGTSAIYNYTDKTNFILEFVLNGNESVTGQNEKTSASTYYIVPGIRTAFNAGNDTEIVPGIAAILGAGPSAVDHDRGLFAYLSIESKLW